MLNIKIELNPLKQKLNDQLIFLTAQLTKIKNNKNRLRWTEDMLTLRSRL